MTSIKFTRADLERAHAEWGCNCGPATLAAVCGLTLEEVRPHFPGFSGWTNVSMMRSALRSWGGRWVSIGVARGELAWPSYGLALIQFEGPWCEPNPARERWLKIERAKRTHWAGVSRHADGVDIWDVNVLGIRTLLGPSNGWDPLFDWERITAPKLTADIKRATGGWHITYAIEVER